MSLLIRAQTCSSEFLGSKSKNDRCHLVCYAISQLMCELEYFLKKMKKFDFQNKLIASSQPPPIIWLTAVKQTSVGFSI
jgi:hypothetical protein